MLKEKLKLRTILLSAALLLTCTAVTGCGTDAGTAQTESSKAAESSTEERSAAEKTTASSATSSSSTTKSTTKTTTTKAPEKKVSYISQRQVQYNKEKNEYEVMFALLDENEEFMDASGTAHIVITDINDTVIYDKNISFAKKDFTSWTNRLRDSSTYGVWLTIPHDDIDGATSKSGTLSLSVKAGTANFDAEKLNISDLPQKKGAVIVPTGTVNITDTRYHSHTSYAAVSDITYEAENDYDGKMTVTLKMVVTLTNKVGEENVADSMAIAYKLTDSEGFVAETGTIYTSNLRVGEKTKEDEKIYDLDPNETYTLTLEDVT